jgi:hypothetical protein
VTFFTPAEIERFQSGKIRAAFLVKMEFESQTMGAWNGNRKLTINDVTYLPMFGAGTIDGLSFTNATISEQVTVSIAGVNNDHLGMVLDEAGEVQDRLMTIYLQMFDDDWQPIAAAPAVFFGYMQPPNVAQEEVTQDANASSPVQRIEVAAENIYFNRSRAPGGRYSERDQQLFSPGDKIFDFMPSLVFMQFAYPDF